ncbi:MAG TPA: hypothetical protein DEP72_09200 [Clostridiales bacterium]|nr:MAG: hypothetical protein A2Y18_05810 [Clostridiales bacterium GWD2_32_19]HCC08316.1 hypothetical protein [Clostridiales bacterium]
MFSLFKKYTMPKTVDEQTDELLAVISKNTDLNKRLNTIRTSVVQIETARDFVEHFGTYLGVPLSSNDFIDVILTKKFKHKAYKYIFSHHELSEFIDTYDEVIEKLKSLKPKMVDMMNREVAIFHDYDSEIGAVKMPLSKFWSLFPKILDVLDTELHHDLLIVSLSFSFGVCVEIEGLDYSITMWGFDKKPHVHRNIKIKEERLNNF